MATVAVQKAGQLLSTCAGMVQDVLGLPTRHVWIDYDKEADVLYMSFRKPQRASKTVEVDDDMIVRTDGRSIVGVTIMNASTHQQRTRDQAS